MVKAESYSIMTDEIGKFCMPNLFSIPFKNTQNLGLFFFTELQFLEKLILLVNFDHFS